MTINLMLIILLIYFIFYFFLKSKKQREKRLELLQQKFPDEWVKIIKEKVYLYNKMPVKLKTSLHNYIKIFLIEKNFVGEEGLEINDEIKLTIASQACLLLLHNRGNYFPYLKSIHVYPNVIILNKNHAKKQKTLLGQSSVGNKSGHDGKILLSWYDVELESKIPSLGSNVVLHEFAHQLDQEFGSATGIPRLKNLQENLQWREILIKDYKQLCEDLDLKKETVFDRYGATNQVEFFAVATETFFTKSQEMSLKHPLLYQQLKNYYKLDPCEWN